MFLAVILSECILLSLLALRVIFRGSVVCFVQYLGVQHCVLFVTLRDVSLVRLAVLRKFLYGSTFAVA